MSKNPCSVVANVFGRDIVGSEVENQSGHYFHFPTNTLWNGMNPFIFHASLHMDALVWPTSKN